MSKSSSVIYQDIIMPTGFPRENRCRCLCALKYYSAGLQLLTAAVTCVPQNRRTAILKTAHRLPSERAFAHLEKTF